MPNIQFKGEVITGLAAFLTADVDEKFSAHMLIFHVLGTILSGLLTNYQKFLGS